jgi:hypothetical protein
MVVGGPPEYNATVSDSDATVDYPVYNGEDLIPRNYTPAPPQTQEIQISGSARNTQFPILVGNNRITGDLMGVRVTSSFFYLAYRLGEAPPGGLSSISNIEIDGESISEGSTTAATGLSWCSYCKAHLGAQSQTVDTVFEGLDFGDYDWIQRHQGTAWIAIRIVLDVAPQFTSIPVVTAEFDAGSITDWDGASRSLALPAVAAYYYMTSERFGFDAAAADFNDTEWDAFADFCDADLSGENRWEVNGALTGQSSRDVLELILKHGFGSIWFWGDEWHCSYLHTLGSATATATQDDFAMVGGFRYTNVSRRKLPNRVFAWFYDTTNKRDDVRVADASDMTPSNCRETQVRLELCTSASMAYRWANTMLGVMTEESRIGRCILHPGIAKDLVPFERLDVTSDVGLADSQWRVTGVKPRVGGFIEVDVRQYSSSALSVATSDPTGGVGGVSDGITISPSTDAPYGSRVGDVSGGDYLDISDKGHLTLSGDATVWEDLTFSATTIGRRGNSDPGWVKVADDGAGSVGVWGLGFDDTTDEEVYADVQFKHAYKHGSTIYPHVHWTPPTGTGSLEKGVAWALEYAWANIGVVDGVGTPVVYGNTTTIYAVDTGIMTAKEHRMVNFTTIDGTGKTLSSVLLCRLYRDVSHSNDDYADDAVLLEFDIHCEHDSLGSQTVSSKT